MTFELGIIGAGNMAEAIVRGVTGAKLVEPSKIIAADPSEQRRELFRRQLGTAIADDNEAAARDAKIVLLSVKPQQAATALASIGSVLSPQSSVLSIMAGVTTAKIEQFLGSRHAWRVIRTMPNTPMLVGDGMVGLCRGRHATDEDVRAAKRLLESCSVVIEVTEDQIDAVTAISGSGPAYFFYLVEQMIEAGKQMGLSEEQARTLAHRTASGAGKMLAQSSDSASELRRKVTSPGGTTQAAIVMMESRGVGDAIIEAIHAAQRRSRELGR